MQATRAATQAARVACVVPSAARLRRVTHTATTHHNNKSSNNSSSCCCCCARRARGDFSTTLFHNCNPEHGAPYAQHERRMRDDEVEDFMRSVKGWLPLHATQTPASSTQRLGNDDKNAGSNNSNNNNNSNNDNSDNNDKDSNDAPPRDTHLLGDDAIMRSFSFDSFDDAYNFMGRLWAFCYATDKYPIVTWERGTCVTIYLYSASYHGLSKREARVAAFANDQYNMLRKSKQQQARLLQQQQQQQGSRNNSSSGLVGDVQSP